MTTAEINIGSDVTTGVWMSNMLRAIAPKNAASFSANLHRWMRSHGRLGDTVYRLDVDGELASVYGAGTLFLGQPYSDYSGDSDFSGAHLMGVLCNGSSATRGCLAGVAPSLVKVENFWAQYMLVGRCAIDVTHSIQFRDHDQRFKHVDGRRTCKWCAASVTNS
ncbi:hypothetical protein [Pseudomonas syringae]|uniref:hypothetical protein n=1 Tax=Pseudomonas syringae TaxID=317 RepID=UPI00245E6FB8|nr:hypothetical protein [Pseudomonas syringae]MDH4602368.1 hypothetical protein [Pseudomonas syringae pv. papulans]